jgi:VanZ family protein
MTERSLGWLARYWLPVLAYVAVIFVLSAQPKLRPPVPWEGSDKLAHLAEYLGLGLLLVRAVRGTSRYRGTISGPVAVLVLGMLVGAADELFQSTVPNRDASLLDFIADTAGLVLSQVLYLTIRRE